LAAVERNWKMKWAEAGETTEETCEKLDLALEIADEAAPSLLMSSLSPVTVDEDRWFDLASVDEDDDETVAANLRYCELRGLVVHHLERPNLIQTLEP
jgi:hypothetical protein